MILVDILITLYQGLFQLYILTKTSAEEIVVKVHVQC